MQRFVSVATRRVWQSQRISSGYVHSRRTSIDKVRSMEGAMEGLKKLTVNVKSVDLRSEFVPSSEAPPQQQSQQPHWWPSSMSPILRCDSPIGQFCTGDCREQKGGAQDEAILANVVRMPRSMERRGLIITHRRSQSGPVQMSRALGKLKMATP